MSLYAWPYPNQALQRTLPAARMINLGLPQPIVRLRQRPKRVERCRGDAPPFSPIIADNGFPRVSMVSQGETREPIVRVLWQKSQLLNEIPAMSGSKIANR